MPSLTKEIDQRRAQFAELLTEQRDIISRYAAMKEKNWPEVERREAALIQKAKDYKLIRSADEPDER